MVRAHHMVLLMVSVACVWHAASQPDPTDTDAAGTVMSALLDVRDALLPDPAAQDLLPGWGGSDDPCDGSWAWLECEQSDSSSQQHVVGLAVSEERLGGPLPLAISRLTHLQRLQLVMGAMEGTLPRQWSTLTALKVLSLGSYHRPDYDPNDGSSVHYSLTAGLPTSWSTLRALTSMAVSFCPDLGGTLPRQWSTLSNLEDLELRGDGIQGSLPPQWESMGHLTALTLDYNQLTGPPPASWMRLSSLQALDFSRNQLSGPLLHEWRALGSSLRSISLSANRFSGTLPEEWGSLVWLESLKLGMNRLSGTLPGAWVGMSRLQALELCNNSLTGSIPHAWSDMTYLHTLDLSYNTLSQESLPTEFFKVMLGRLAYQVWFNFTHPDIQGVSTIRDLKALVSYNVCPSDVVPQLLNQSMQAHSAATSSPRCINADDQTLADRFSAASRDLLQRTDSMPLGHQWALVVKGDMFQKTSVRVMDEAGASAAAYYYRFYIAALAAVTEQAFEQGLLEQAMALADTPLLVYIRAQMTLAANKSCGAGSICGNSTGEAAFQQLLTALCGCGRVPMNTSTQVTWAGSGHLLQALNNTAGGITGAGQFADTVCAAAGLPGAQALSSSPANITYCARWLLESVAWRDNMTAEVRRLLVDRRLGDGRLTGKVGARNTIETVMSFQIFQEFPELQDGTTFADNHAANISADLSNASISDLAEFLAAGGPGFYGRPPSTATLNMTRAAVYVPWITLPELAVRARSRFSELRAQQLASLGISIPAVRLLASASPQAYPSNITVEQLLATFSRGLGIGNNSRHTLCRKSCTRVVLRDSSIVYLSSTTLPEPDAAGMNWTTTDGIDINLATPYRLVSWSGGAEQYRSCNLQQRAPAYVGVCRQLPVLCQATTDPNAPWQCTDLASSAANSAGASLQSRAYREGCELPCGHKQDCDLLCSCDEACAAWEACVCRACGEATSLGNMDASTDPLFVDLVSSALPEDSGSIASVPDARHRRLVDGVTAQAFLGSSSGDAPDFSSSVDLATPLQTQLDVAVARLQSATHGVLQAELNSQAEHLRQALEAGAVTAVVEAYGEWRAARQAAALIAKNAQLASIPCTNATLTVYPFVLNTSQDVMRQVLGLELQLHPPAHATPPTSPSPPPPDLRGRCGDRSGGAWARLIQVLSCKRSGAGRRH